MGIVTGRNEKFVYAITAIDFVELELFKKILFDDKIKYKTQKCPSVGVKIFVSKGDLRKTKKILVNTNFPTSISLRKSKNGIMVVFIYLAIILFIIMVIGSI